MPRAVTADHVLFDECIEVFRSENKKNTIFECGPSFSHLLTSFQITKSWGLGIYEINPTNEVRLAGAYSAFISKIKNPKSLGTHNPHLFGLALSTIISFSTLTSCKSPRDDYLCRNENLSLDSLHQLALMHPILTAGPGAINTRVSEKDMLEMESDVEKLIEKLMSIDYKIYRIVMQSIRMIHLSLSIKRDDFGLAYLLVVSAIEAVAQEAIKRDKVKKKHPNEKEWRERSKEDPMFKELLDSYLKSRGFNNYLTERFVFFIEKFAPIEEWGNYVEHPQKKSANYISEMNPTFNTEFIVKKQWFEKYPEDFDRNKISKILSNAYRHRSDFIHQGKQPPHREPNSTFKRFFQSYTDHNYEEKFLPNYELLIGLAKASILNWLDTK